MTWNWIVKSNSSWSVWFLYALAFMGWQWFVCLRSMLSFGFSGVLYIMMPRHGMPVETSDWSASRPRNIMTLLGPLSTLCDSPWWFLDLYMSELSIRYYNIRFVLSDHYRKRDFSTMILKYFDKISWHHHHSNIHTHTHLNTFVRSANEWDWFQTILC